MSTQEYFDGWAIRMQSPQGAVPPQYTKAFETKAEAEEQSQSMTKQKNWAYSIVRGREYFNRAKDPITGEYTRSTFAENHPHWSGAE